MKETRSGVTAEQRGEIGRSLRELVERLAEEMKLDPCAVALELRYWHQKASNPYRTTVKPSDKQASLKHFGGICQRCKVGPPLKLGQAVFHHKDRGFAGQHQPPNLEPFHSECHDREHGLADGVSVHRGSPRAKVR